MCGITWPFLILLHFHLSFFPLNANQCFVFTAPLVCISFFIFPFLPVIANFFFPYPWRAFNWNSFFPHFTVVCSFFLIWSPFLFYRSVRYLLVAFPFDLFPFLPAPPIRSPLFLFLLFRLSPVLCFSHSISTAVLRYFLSFSLMLCFFFTLISFHYQPCLSLSLCLL
jgi:hypothetical protein